MGITVQQVGVLTCASRLCLRSLTRHRQLLDVELYCNQLLQVLELIYKKCHGKSPAVVGHLKQCYSYFRTAAIKYETRQQSSSTTGLQLQQPTVAAVTSPPLPSLRPHHGTFPAINAGECNVGRRGRSWESIRSSVYRHHGLQVRDHGRMVMLGLHRHRGRRARASPSLRASRSGFTVTAGVTCGRHHHDDGAGTRTSYFTIGRVPLLELRSDRKRPSRAPVTVPAVARYWSQELTDPGTQN